MTATLPERPAKLAKWKPRKWDVVYDQIVMLDTLGTPQKQIAEMFGYTVQHISNIVQCPQAKLTRGKVLEQLSKSAIEKVSNDLELLAVQAKKRIAQVLYNDELFERSPFAVVDRGIAVLKGVGKLKTEDEAARGIRINKAVIFTSDDAKAVREALSKADEAKLLHPIDVTPSEPSGNGNS